MKKFAYATGLLLLTGVAAGVGQTALAQTTPAVETPAAASAPAAALTANVTLASQYRYRGLMQTNNKPAIQGGFDYAIPGGLLPEGFYVGNWNSSISWLSDANASVSAPIEMDFYGGYKTEIVKDVPIDVGVLQYYYPGSYPEGFTRPHTTEGYAQIGYGPVTFKYSHAFSNLFGFADSHHSQYFDLSGNFDTGFWGLTLNLHVGYQDVKHQNPRASYADWKIGVTKDFGSGWTASLAYIDTNASRLAYTNSHGNYMGKATALLSVTKTFQ
ncbi:TorF family putative porin [Ralstonia solanacearum]|uniref:TorF family putative porin n=1 Tax=Ralstonia solanacearum TaxID=305 RepID=UPI001EDCAA0D|nr:TorF family putative porin [Ralstonia solanacearum]MCG3573759.1 TorF family putative porin [Ralstonia solanacearum]MCL9843181.1 TorF family putative porin [Ralstonia solanacearum]